MIFIMYQQFKRNVVGVEIVWETLRQSWQWTKRKSKITLPITKYTKKKRQLKKLKKKTKQGQKKLKECAKRKRSEETEQNKHLRLNKLR